MRVKGCMIMDLKGEIILSRVWEKVDRGMVCEWGKSLSKLIKKNQQHSFAESDRLRFMYQMMEELYVVVVVCKESNMIEDMEVLKMCQKVVLELVKELNESQVIHHAIDLLLAFDDIVINGQRQSNSL